MTTQVLISVPAERGTEITPGANLRLVKDQPVAVRDLADELGVTPAALHQQIRAGRVPAFKMRNTKWVTPGIAQQIREWLPANRFKPWPVFTEQPPADETTDEGSPQVAEGPEA